MPQFLGVVVGDPIDRLVLRYAGPEPWGEQFVPLAPSRIVGRVVRTDHGTESEFGPPCLEKWGYEREVLWRWSRRPGPLLSVYDVEAARETAPPTQGGGATPNLARSAPMLPEVAALIARHGFQTIRDDVISVVAKELEPALQRFPDELRMDPHFQRAENKLLRLYARQRIMDETASPTANWILEQRIKRVWDELWARDCEPAGICPDCGEILWRLRNNTGRCVGRELQRGHYAGIVYHPPTVETPRNRYRFSGAYVPSDIRGAVCLSPERVAAVKASLSGC